MCEPDFLGAWARNVGTHRGVGKHAQGLRQAFEDLLRSGDAVPPARERPEANHYRDGRVAEPLDLLQHGVGAPAREDVAGQEQQRESIGMRDGPPPSPCLLRQGRSNSCRPSCGAADSPWRHGEKIDLATLDIVLGGGFESVPGGTACARKTATAKSRAT